MTGATADAVAPGGGGVGGEELLEGTEESATTTLAQLVDSDLTAAIRLVMERGWKTEYAEMMDAHTRKKAQGIRQLTALSRLLTFDSFSCARDILIFPGDIA